MRRVSSVLVVVAGLSACARPNPLYGLPAATEGTTTDGAIVTGGTTRSSPGTGRPDDDDDDDDDGQTQAEDGEPTATAVPDDTGPKLDMGDGVEPASPCCEPTFGRSGCVEVDLEECVCTLDDYCCVTEWDQTCVDVAIEDCGALCINDGSCCAPSTALGCVDDAIQDCVCDVRPACCDDAWDIACVTITDRACSEGCFTGNNDCCFATPDDVGCIEPETWSCVCPEDPFCCEEFWDALCVGVAVDCGLCPLPGAMSDCCVESPPGGCLDHALGPGVMNCVCEIDESCCVTSWDADCIQLGLEQCTLDCP